MILPQVNAKLKNLFIPHEGVGVMFSPIACIGAADTSEHGVLTCREDTLLLVQVAFIIECLINRYDEILVSPPSLIREDESSKSSSILSFYCQGIKNFLVKRDHWKSIFLQDHNFTEQKSEIVVNCFAYVLLKSILHCMEWGYAIGIFDGAVGSTHMNFYSQLTSF